MADEAPAVEPTAELTPAQRRLQRSEAQSAQKSPAQRRLEKNARAQSRDPVAAETVGAFVNPIAQGFEYVMENPGPVARFVLEEVATEVALRGAGKLVKYGPRVFREGGRLVQTLVRGGGAATGAAAGSILSESFNPTDNPFANAVTTAGFAVGGEAVTGALGAAGRAVAGKPGEDAMALKARSGVGPVLRKRQAGEGGIAVPFGDLIEQADRFHGPFRLIEYLPGGQVFVRARGNAERVLTGDLIALSNAMEATGASTADVGKMFRTALEHQDEAFRTMGGLRYERLIDAVDASGDNAVDLSRVLAADSKVLRKHGDRLLLEQVRDDGTVDFRTAQKIRQAFREARDTTKMKMGEKAEVREIISNLTEAMHKTASRTDPNLAKALDSADEFWRAGKEKFLGDSVSQALRLTPKKAYDMIMAGGGDRDVLRAIRAVLYDPTYIAENPGAQAAADAAMRELREQFMRDAIGKTAHAEMERNARGSINFLRQFDRTGFSDELFLGNVSQLNNFRETLKALRRVQDRFRQSDPKTMRASLRVLLGAGAAGGALATGDISLLALAVGSDVLAHVFTSRPFASALNGLAKAKPGSPAFVRYLTRAARLMQSQERTQGAEDEASAPPPVPQSAQQQRIDASLRAIQ